MHKNFDGIKLNTAFETEQDSKTHILKIEGTDTRVRYVMHWPDSLVNWFA